MHFIEVLQKIRIKSYKNLLFFTVRYLIIKIIKHIIVCRGLNKGGAGCILANRRCRRAAAARRITTCPPRFRKLLRPLIECIYVTHFPPVQNIDLHNYCVCHIISVTLTMMSVIDIAHLRAIHSRTRSFILFIKLRFSEKATQFEKKNEF